MHNQTKGVELKPWIKYVHGIAANMFLASMASQLVLWTPRYRRCECICDIDRTEPNVEMFKRWKTAKWRTDDSSCLRWGRYGNAVCWVSITISSCGIPAGHSMCYDSCWSINVRKSSEPIVLSLFLRGILYYKRGLLSPEPLAIEASCQRAGWQITGRGQKNDVHRLWHRHLICNKHAAPWRWYIWLNSCQ